VDSNATAPATTTDLTLRIGFVLLSRADQTKCGRTSETFEQDDRTKNLSAA
jgi:hypothetical protein